MKVIVEDWGKGLGRSKVKNVKYLHLSQQFGWGLQSDTFQTIFEHHELQKWNHRLFLGIRDLSRPLNFLGGSLVSTVLVDLNSLVLGLFSVNIEFLALFLSDFVENTTHSMKPDIEIIQNVCSIQDCTADPTYMTQDYFKPRKPRNGCVNSRH